MRQKQSYAYLSKWNAKEKETVNPSRVLIVDDERLSRRRLRRLLAQDTTLEVVGECSTARDALRLLQLTAIDIVFLDIQMPGMDGFEFLNFFGQDRNWCVIFVSAHDNFALRAFDAQALDYLLKPYEDSRLREAVRRAKAHLANLKTRRQEDSRPAEGTPVSYYRERLAVRVGDKLLLLRDEQVDWIEAADNYVNLHCGGETHLVRETMSTLQKTLDPRKFLRIHRSAIVNLDRIKALQPWFRGDYRVVLSTGAILTLSRGYRKSLEERILNP
jgi:two-component system LytT family response regulator